MTMSIAFIALIFGFLLGKFTSDRNHILKSKGPTTHRPITIVEHEIDKVIASVIDAARARQTATNSKDQYFREGEDALQLPFFRTNFTRCLSEVPDEQQDESLEDSLNNILRNHYNMYLKCARDLRSMLILND
jgi:hypothetical protein